MLWKIILGIVLGSLLAVGGWTTTRTATMADRHPTRFEFKEVQNTIKNNQTKIEKKIDKIIDHLIIKGE